MIVGIGQPAAGDDGVGREVARRLRAEGVPAREVADGAGLLGVLDGLEGRLVVVDAAVGVGPPGTVVVARPDELAAARPVSSHGLSVAEALALAAALRGAPLDVRLVAVAIDPPEAGAPVGAGLSEPVAKAVPVAARLARKLGEG